MAGPLQATRQSDSITNRAPVNGDVQTVAAQILSETRIGNGTNATHRVDFIEAALDKIADANPALAAAVRAEIVRGLSVTDQGRMERDALIRGEPGITRDAGNGQTVPFAANSNISQEQWIAEARAGGYRDYAIYAQLAGSNDNAAILRTIDDVYHGRITPSQFAAAGAAVDATGAPIDLVSLGLDLTQMSLDVVGIFDQSGISDGANALISAGRGDWVGAGLSLLAAVPVFGALATAGKLGKWAQTISKAIEAAASNPAARAGLEPALRRIHEALKSAPDAVMRALPDNIRQTIEGIKTKLDDFFRAAAGSVYRNADGSLNLSSAAARYAEIVGSNRPWSWADDFGEAFTAGEKREIRQDAVERGLVPNLGLKPGTRHADFEAAGLIQKVDTLPKELWTKGDGEQFRWLDARIPGGRPEGMTWHHSEIDGRMELVPFGPHNTINHIGGRSPGHWAHAPR